MSSNAKGIGAIKCLSASILTERGLINIYGYSIETEYNRYGPLFQKVASSVSLNNSLRYKKEWSIIEEGLIRHIGNFNPVFTGPRVGNLITFLKDLRLISEEGVITKDGKDLLNDRTN